MRIHHKACERARTRKCRCQCGGSLHQTVVTDQQAKAGWRALTLDDGAQVADVIRQLLGTHYECLGVCGTTRPALPLMGYPHDAGLADKDGKHWWAFADCDDCGYGTSWQKLLRRAIRRPIVVNAPDERDVLRELEISGQLASLGA